MRKPTPILLESQIETAVCRYARAKGCLAYKFTSPARRGVPDRIITAPNGRVLFLEFKAHGQKPTPLQEREMKLLQENAQLVAWVDNVEEGRDSIDYLCQLPPLCHGSPL